MKYIKVILTFIAVFLMLCLGVIAGIVDEIFTNIKNKAQKPKKKGFLGDLEMVE